ncbi:MAG: DEAD/DEAH box helicase family protein [bacterium]|nr:DEAD/DEAH box helicase family protein [bacterium]
MNELKFSGQWRDYQKRILEDLNFHLADNKIHVVAAPGAGKTTLGIEVIARIKKSTLILAPTITIRNQWKQRIIDSFLNGNSEDILSTDIKEPKFITIITYQALLAAFCGTKENEENEEKAEEEIDEDKITSNKRFLMEKADAIIKTLKKSGIKLICFDEAHHLRNEWWKALDYLMENLKPEQTVALTATPPYDAEAKEWERYENLCGPIDEIISIPELVDNGDLCPHQDFIHFSLLRKHENEKFNESLSKINNFMKSLFDNEVLISIVLKKLSKETEETILETPKTYIAVCSFLKQAKTDIPQDILALFGVKLSQIPNFNLEYQKLFLTYILVPKEEYETEKEKNMIALLSKQAKEAGVLQNKTIYLNDSPKMKRQLANSIGKLDSISKIVDLEVSALKNDLRMVILADYIKYDNTDMTELGVIPIWQMLKNRPDISLAVLTGSIILIHKKIEKELFDCAKNLNCEEYISASPFDRDENYLKITPKGTKKSCVVDLITKMFIDGHITIMVGTQALLGEGWDAPVINSLILSSTISSYMLSNQMRGRAIRIDKNNPDKISNIWHLASVKILSITEQVMQGLHFKPAETTDNIEPVVELSDYNQLKQRFNGYQAPSNKQPCYIESGIERILPSTFIKKLNASTISEDDFIGLNKIMEMNAFDRSKTKQLWQIGVAKTYDAPPRVLKNGVESEIKVKNFYYKGTYWALFATWGFIWLGIFSSVNSNDLKLYSIWFGICLIGFCISMLKPTLRYLRCSSPEKIMRQIAIVMLETLSAMGKIKTNLQMVSLECQTNETDFSIFFNAANLSPEENNLLVSCLLEFLNPIENPRYLFVRKDRLFNAVGTTDYHSIPAVISVNKSNIVIFQKLWQKYIGKCDVIYTRNAQGRRTLLKARKNSFSDLFRPKKARVLSRFE